jgi:hypothetical protein
LKNKICADVAAEKVHNAFINGVEGFDKSSMKHIETEEKNPLPPIEGLFESQFYDFGLTIRDM